MWSNRDYRSVRTHTHTNIQTQTRWHKVVTAPKKFLSGTEASKWTNNPIEKQTHTRSHRIVCNFWRMHCVQASADDDDFYLIFYLKVVTKQIKTSHTSTAADLKTDTLYNVWLGLRFFGHVIHHLALLSRISFASCSPAQCRSFRPPLHLGAPFHFEGWLCNVQW